MPKQSAWSLRLARLAVSIAATLTLAGVAGAAGSFDGTYKGRQTTLRSDPTTCPSLDIRHTTVVVRDNHFERRWHGSNLEIDIAGDGTIHSQSNVGGTGKGQTIVFITGTVTGGNLEADIVGHACAAHLSLKKS